MDTEQMTNSVAIPKVCNLVIVSFVFFIICLPFVGLPLAIMALSRIKKSNGLLYGRTGAIIGIVLNSLALVTCLLTLIVRFQPGASVTNLP